MSDVTGQAIFLLYTLQDFVSELLLGRSSKEDLKTIITTKGMLSTGGSCLLTIWPKLQHILVVMLNQII